LLFIQRKASTVPKLLMHRLFHKLHLSKLLVVMPNIAFGRSISESGGRVSGVVFALILSLKSLK